MQHDDAPGIAVLGGGPAGLTGAYTLGLRGQSAVVFEADHQVGGIAKTVEFRRLPLRPRRSPVLHEDQAGRAPLGAPDGRRLPDAAPAVADLLQRSLLLVPADGEGRRRQARPRRVGALRALVPVGAPHAPAARRHVRGMGHRAVRRAGSTTRSSARTPRRSGASRARRSARCGRPSGSRTSRSGRRS